MTNEKLIKALRNCGSTIGDCGLCFYKNHPMCHFQMAIDAADAIEAVEKRIAELMPKEGEWIFSRGDGKTCADGWTCSACGNSFHTNVPYFEEFHYCPNCGARMRTVTDCHTLEEGER